jgi:SagB-type dehydrogenase family enzyme
MKTPSAPMTDRIRTTEDYHERTKHQPHAYARSLGYLDWATQPDPFRRFHGAPVLPLAHPQDCAAASYHDIFTSSRPAQPVVYQAISQLFFDALALSAWKEAAPGNRWSLRVNPSSGDLHPTEGYLIIGPTDGLSDSAAVYHYAPYEHALEQRIVLAATEWEAIARSLPPAGFLVGLTSIYWRESWKYGERAFRYCHHDVGHAIGTIAAAAAVLAWRVAVLNGPSTEAMAVLLGCHEQWGIEAEHADCLLVVAPGAEAASASLELSAPLLSRLRQMRFAGHPNRLSDDHHEWLIIDRVATATRYPGRRGGQALAAVKPRQNGVALPTHREVAARRLIHQRRSAVAMDGQTWIDVSTFYHMLGQVTPGVSPFPYNALPWRPRLSLALMVHRVRGFGPGLYLLVRHPSHFPSLRNSLTAEFSWRKPAWCPKELPLYLLAEGDAREVARFVSCHQAIASDGIFSLGMLAEFTQSLKNGAWMYPRLFWEAGLIGQVLYLEAEAADIRATGIGCFFDDMMHELLGIADRSWQSLYHFTLGGAVDDPRLKTLHPYVHKGLAGK